MINHPGNNIRSTENIAPSVDISKQNFAPIQLAQKLHNRQ
jgi:hypothetical protein